MSIQNNDTFTSLATQNLTITGSLTIPQGKNLADDISRTLQPSTSGGSFGYDTTNSGFYAGVPGKWNPIAVNYQSFTGINFTGPWAVSSPGFILNYSIFVNQKFIGISPGNTAPSVNNLPMSFPAGTIPPSMIPIGAPALIPILVVNNSLNVLGSMKINADGSGNIYADLNGGSFTAAGNAGFPASGSFVWYQ
jgi:hypothetical protein